MYIEADGIDMDNLIQFSEVSGVLLLEVLLEKLDLFETPNVLTSVEHAIETNHSKGVIIDLKNVLFIDSSGIGFLIAVRNKLSKKGVLFFVANANDTVMQVFRLTKVIQLIPAFQTLDEALQAVKA